MKTLTEQYYNAIVTQLNLSDQHFQLAQGNVALPSTTQNIWSLMDQVPPLSICGNWTPGSHNTFSSQYGGVLSRVHDASSGQFQAAMGDYYTAWMTYLKNNPPSDGKTIIQVFSGWAYANMPPDKANQVIGMFQAALNGPITQAQMAWAAAGGQTGVKAYTSTVETISNVLSGAPSGTVTLDASTQSSNTSHTWAAGAVEGFYDIFFGGGEASYDKVSSEVIASSLNFDIEFKHVSTIPVTPLSQGQVIAGPDTFNPWYVPNALTTAYSNNNGNTWQSGTPDWTTYFGPQGSLPRAVDALLLVDGITITISSSKSIATSDHTDVQSAFEAGFFPFFGVAGEGGWTLDKVFDDQGRLAVSASCDVGHPQILGILQSAIGSYVQKDNLQAAMIAARAGQGTARSAVKSFDAEVRASEGSDELVGVSLNWSDAAMIGLENFANTQVRMMVMNQVNNWAVNSRPHWADNSLHTLNTGVGTATARAGRSPAGTMSVVIVAFA
ncbi:hypothetical protein [Jannaschia marina]|uniref:hypothetical protein n=1 Tax=Jannaschia marina TaxID=2741674 RepID=UPI0015CC6620|nr:hypothetical protein [Jannaschia marina]